MPTFYRFSPVFRISLAIVSLMAALICAFDTFFDLLPSARQQQIESRKQVSVVIADQIAQLIVLNHQTDLQQVIDQLTVANPKIRSIGIRAEDKHLVAASKLHAANWKDASESALSTQDHIVVPVSIGNVHFGNVEFNFSHENEWNSWIQEPTIMFLGLFSTLGFFFIYVYLKRVLEHLDPSRAAPQRVKVAFDTLTESILLINPKKRILLANTAFYKMNEGNSKRIEGKSIMQLEWLLKGFSEQENQSYPWDDALKFNQTMPPKTIKIVLPNGNKRELIMNCCPIDDGTGVARGCLTTFNDVTEIAETNRQLQAALQELRSSRDKIEEQNTELQRHANIDPLTGCLNRRAFFGQAQSIFQSAVLHKQNLFCIMADIDHFKSFNDKYGHSVGDSVIQEVVNAMKRALRSTDLFCRYGGEEFCILIANKDGNAMEIAERMREAVERESGQAVTSTPGLRITSSFGMSMYGQGNLPNTLEEFIDQADKALYDAKHGGRNRVALYHSS